jgi:hypothetical protein
MRDFRMTLLATDDGLVAQYEYRDEFGPWRAAEDQGGVFLEVLLQGLLRQADAEIEAHPTWCSPSCQTFLPSEYRRARMQGLAAERVQQDYDLCHAWR